MGAEIVPVSKEDGPISRKKYAGVCVKVYMSQEDFQAYAKLAERAGKRRVGLLLYTQKPKGFANEKLANTDGIARFLKMAGEFWGEHQDELEAEAKKLREDQERLKRYGIRT